MATVLLVGRRARVLRQLADTLEERGHEVRWTSDATNVRPVAAGVDVLAMGRAVTGHRRDALVVSVTQASPGVRVVDGLAPLTPVLVAQVEEALLTPAERLSLTTTADSAELDLDSEAPTEIVLHTLDWLWHAHETPLVRSPAGPGRLIVPLPRGRDRRFVVARVADSVAVRPVPH